MIRFATSLLLIAGLVGCSDGVSSGVPWGDGASSWNDQASGWRGSVARRNDPMKVLAPESVPLRWDSSFNGVGDGVGALIPVDVMIYGGRTGEPFANTEVVIEPDDGVIWVLSPSDVYPEYGIKGEYGSNDYGNAAYGDGSFRDGSEGRGRCIDCRLTWDAWRGEYVVLPDLFLDDPVAYTDRTDEDGVVRLYLYVDSLVDDYPEHFLDGSVVISVGSHETILLLSPQ